MFPIISSDELRNINNAINTGLNEIEVSLDLGITKTKIKLAKAGFYIKNKLIKIISIRDDDKSCYIITNKPEKVQFFSSKTNCLYKLIPTSFRPILQISGTPMHKKEFIERIEKDKLKGSVLDAGTGLGYTAIAESKTADKIVTIEKDKEVIEIAKLNPYSQDLFNKKIKLVIGDLTEKIKKFRNEEFDFIVFDAGTPKSSGDFFSLKNYEQAFRVLKKKGKLYHYLPKLHIKRGRDFAEEIIKRIKKAGFSKIERKVEESYIVAS